MDRFHLKGERRNRLHAVLCATGYNIRWLLHMIAKKGVPFLKRFFLRLAAAVGLLRGWLGSSRQAFTRQAVAAPQAMQGA